jgi:NAD(P)-dependent dehydrogenase (short-subunit alcohol dehydrogenase family)
MEERPELFKGKVCVVTGAGGGIGLGITRQLLLRGATVYMADHAEKKLLAAGESLADYGNNVYTERLDVTDYDAFRSFIARVEKKEPIDYIFNNAGVGWGGFFGAENMENIRKVLDVNLYGVIHGVKAVLPYMLKRESGHIVNIASVAAVTPLPLQSVYVASKCAVRGLTECLRFELEPFKIKVTVVCPGAVATEIFRDPKNIPSEAISIDQAGVEILEGIEQGKIVLPIEDWARGAYRDVTENPAANEQAMRQVFLDTLARDGMTVTQFHDKFIEET